MFASEKYQERKKEIERIWLVFKESMKAEKMVQKEKIIKPFGLSLTSLYSLVLAGSMELNHQIASSGGVSKIKDYWESASLFEVGKCMHVGLCYELRQRSG